VSVTPGRAIPVSLPLPIHHQLTPPFGSPFTIPVAANPAGPPPTRLATRNTQGPPMQEPLPTGAPTLTAPRFYINHRPPAVPPRSHRELQPSAPFPHLLSEANSRVKYSHFPSGDSDEANPPPCALAPQVRHSQAPSRVRQVQCLLRRSKSICRLANIALALPEVIRLTAPPSAGITKDPRFAFRVRVERNLARVRRPRRQTCLRRTHCGLLTAILALAAAHPYLEVPALIGLERDLPAVR
jgi:hypothetical protein